MDFKKIALPMSLALSFFIGASTYFMGYTGDVSAEFLELVRITNGQIPFVDYFSQFSPIAAYSIWPIYYFLKNNILMHIVASGLLNAVLSYLLYSILFKYLRDEKLSLISIFLTAIWNTPQVGGFYYDNFVVALGLLAFNLVVVDRNNLSSSRVRWFFSGVLVAIGFFAKQNTGFAVAIAFYSALIFNLNSNTYKQYICSLVGCVYAATFATSYFIYLSSYKDFLDHFFLYIFEYSKYTEKNTYSYVFRSLIIPNNYPLQIILDNFYPGLLLFLPAYLVITCFNFLVLKNIFFKHGVALVIPVFIFVLNFLCFAVVGRGFTNTSYLIGFIFIYVFSMFNNKKIITFGLLYLFLVGLINFIHNCSGDIKIISEKNLPYKQISPNDPSSEEVAKLRGFLESKHGSSIAIIGFPWSNQVTRQLDLIPVNYQFFYLPFKYSHEVNKAQQIREIRNIRKFSPSFVILPKNPSEFMGGTSTISDYMNSRNDYIIEKGFSVYNVYIKANEY